MARNCPSCGRANDDDARFCSGCGAEIALPQPMPSAAPPAPPSPSSPPPPAPPPPMAQGGPPPRRGLSPALIIVIIVVVLLVTAIAATLVVLLLMPSGSSVDGGATTPTPIAAASSAVPTPAAGEFLAAAVGRQGNVLGTVTADGTVKELSSTLGPQIYHIAYSPDGQSIACIAGSWKRPKLSIVDVAQGTVQQVRIARPAIVAVDSIAWLGPQSLLVAGFTTTPKSQGEDAELLVYDPAADSAEPLADATGVALRGVSVSASADGTRVAFVTYTDQKTDQYGLWTASERLNVLDRTSGTVTRLGSSKALFDVNSRAFDDPLISPTGTAVIYRRAGSDVGTAYTVVDVNGTTLMPAKELMYPAGYAWDPGGTKVMFTGQPINSTGNGAVSFFLFDTSLGGPPKVVTKYKKTVVQDLAWSPDGSTIAWAEWDTGKFRSGNLYLMNPSGGDSRRLADWALMPAWAPDAVASP